MPLYIVQSAQSQCSFIYITQNCKSQCLSGLFNLVCDTHCCGPAWHPLLFWPKHQGCENPVEFHSFPSFFLNNNCDTFGEVLAIFVWRLENMSVSVKIVWNVLLCYGVIFPHPGPKLSSYVQSETLISQLNFGADWTMCSGVVAISFVILKHHHSPHRHRKPVWRKVTILKTKHGPDVGVFLT